MIDGKLIHNLSLWSAIYRCLFIWLRRNSLYYLLVLIQLIQILALIIFEIILIILNLRDGWRLVIMILWVIQNAIRLDRTLWGIFDKAPLIIIDIKVLSIEHKCTLSRILGLPWLICIFFNLERTSPKLILRRRPLVIKNWVSISFRQ